MWAQTSPHVSCESPFSTPSTNHWPNLWRFPSARDHLQLCPCTNCEYTPCKGRSWILTSKRSESCGSSAITRNIGRKILKVEVLHNNWWLNDAHTVHAAGLHADLEVTVMYAKNEISSIIVIPEIGNSALRNAAASLITIPDSLTEIGSWAFTNCSRLENVAVPDRVTIIHRGTFWDWGFLERVTIAGVVAEIGDCAFASCTWLKNMTIPDSVAMPLPIAAARKTSQFVAPNAPCWQMTSRYTPKGLSLDFVWSNFVALGIY